VYSTIPDFGVNVTFDPETVEVYFEVMSVVPINSFAVVGTELVPTVTVITPPVPPVTVGAV
jgi:hypothetical protein